MEDSRCRRHRGKEPKIDRPDHTADDVDGKTSSCLRRIRPEQIRNQGKIGLPIDGMSRADGLSFEPQQKRKRQRQENGS